MGVLGERVAQLQFAHQVKARTIGEGPRLVRVLEEEGLDFAKSFGVRKYGPTRARRIHNLKEGTQQMRQAADFEERGGFIKK